VTSQAIYEPLVRQKFSRNDKLSIGAQCSELDFETETSVHQETRVNFSRKIFAVFTDVMRE
jgi:hypothetical protein